MLKKLTAKKAFMQGMGFLDKLDSGDHLFYPEVERMHVGWFRGKGPKLPGKEEEAIIETRWLDFVEQDFGA